jgi:hypothetical protein
MPATLATIIRRARLDFGDDDNRDIVNEYLMLVAAYVQPLSQWATTTSIASQQGYFVTENSPIDEVLWGSGSNAFPLIRITTEDLRLRGIDWANATSLNYGTPEFFIPSYGVNTTGQFGFMLYPIPDVTGTTIQYNEGYGGASLTNTTDVTPMPDAAITAVIKGCQYERALLNEPEKANLYFSAYTRAIQEAVYIMATHKSAKRFRGDSL